MFLFLQSDWAASPKAEVVTATEGQGRGNRRHTAEGGTIPDGSAESREKQARCKRGKKPLRTEIWNQSFCKNCLKTAQTYRVFKGFSLQRNCCAG